MLCIAQMLLQDVLSSVRPSVRHRPAMHCITTAKSIVGILSALPVCIAPVSFRQTIMYTYTGCGENNTGHTVVGDVIATVSLSSLHEYVTSHVT